MTIIGDTDNSNWKLQLEAYETSYSIPNNNSVVRVDMYLKRVNSRGYLGGDWSASITVDGSTQYLSGNISYPTYVNANETLYLGTKDFTVGHNTDGTKTAGVSASFSSSDFTPHSGSASGSLSLTNIPRYASISQTLSSKTETSITMNWSSDSTIDRVWYSTDNGSTWSSAITVNAKNGSYTIENLTANTTYNIKTRVRRKDSQLTSDSSKLSVATYDYPHVSNLVNKDFIIGDAITVDFYNPLSRTITYYVYDDTDTVIKYDSGPIGGINITLDSNLLYESIPNKQTGNWYIIVEYGQIERTSDTGTYSVDATINLPTFEDFTFRDSNTDVVAVTGDNQILVKTLSTLEVTIPVANKMIPKNYATGSRYDISCANRSASVNYSDDTTLVSTLGTISTAGSVACNVKAVDSRNLATVVNKAINVVDYTKPNIVTNVGRVNNFETTTNISCTGSFSKILVNNTTKNDISRARFRYKKTTDNSYGSWTNFDITVNKNNGTYECANKVVLLDNTQTYMIEFEVKDLFTSETVIVVVSEGVPIMFLSSTNKNVGIGTQNQYEEYSLEVLNGIYCDTLHCNNYDGPGGTGGGGEVLPVGSEIDYDGQASDIPTGWEQIDDPYQYIVATISSQQTASSSYVVNLNKIERKQGDFTLSGGFVKIPAGVKKVRVSGSVFINSWPGDRNYLWGKIFKNTNPVAAVITGSPGSYLSAPIPSTVIEVVENDVIKLMADSGPGGTVRAGVDNTWLCVEKVE